jgi:putative ABC transport system permease protein
MAMIDLLQLRLARRNLLRQPRRTLIALSSILFGVLALLLSCGFIEWIFWAMRDATVHSRLGHIQIAKAGYFSRSDDDPSTFVLPTEAPELGQIASVPQVRTIAPRLTFSGLASRGESTVSFIGEGVDPEKEESVSRLLHIVNGKSLSRADPKGIIVGQGLASVLGVNIGDPLILLVNTASGGINAVEGHVRGTFYTVSKQFDDSALRLPISLARELLRVAGSHTWIVVLDDTDQTQQVSARLKSELGKGHNALEIKSWYELADFYNKTVTLYSRQMNVVKLIIGLIIILTIANTMTMNILERTGEIGTLMALGNKRRQIMGLFVMEGLLLGLVGGTAGALIGNILAGAISYVGIPMPPAPGMSAGFTGEILVTPVLTAQALIIAITTSVTASVFPAWKASKLNIVDALRHNR